MSADFLALLRDAGASAAHCQTLVDEQVDELALLGMSTALARVLASKGDGA